MPRTGITESQVISAIEAILARGESVTKVTIRRELGDTGSFGTITSYLQAWRQKQSQKEDAPEASLPIPETVQGHFGRAWSAALAAAQAELAPQREAMAQEAASLKSVLAQAQAEHDEAERILEAEIDSLTARLEEAGVREQATQARLTDLAEKLGYLQGKFDASETEAKVRIAEKDARIVELEALLANPQVGSNFGSAGIPTKRG